MATNAEQPSGEEEAKATAERKHQELEAQLRQAQKMEVIGRLAGGVAHDFNNLLTIILGYCELLQTEMTPQHPWHVHINEIHKAAMQATSVARQLLAFTRKQVLAPKILPLHTVVAEMHNLLRRLIGEHIRLEVVPGADLGHVQADSGQLEQVVRNLVINARDAMPQGGTPTLSTATG